MSLDDVLHDVLEERGGGVTVWHVRCLEAYLRSTGQTDDRYAALADSLMRGVWRRTGADRAAERLAHDMVAGSLDRAHLDALDEDAIRQMRRHRSALREDAARFLTEES